MVGFSPHDLVQLSDAEYAAAGAVSGSITRCVAQPLDVLKIRFQVKYCVGHLTVKRYWVDFLCEMTSCAI